MRIAIGNDHGGYVLRHDIIKYLKENGHEVIDCGTDSEQSVDYSDFAYKAAMCVKEGKADLGILMCGTGIGISIAANKIPGIRCAALSDTFTAHATKEHNNANMMALGGRTVGPGLAVDIVATFINTPFSNDERHVRRLYKITEIEEEFFKK